LQSHLTVAVHSEERRTVVTVEGELDLASCHLLEQAIEEARGLSGVVVVDLRGLLFTDMSGLRVLLLEHQRLEQDGKRLVLVNVGDNVTRLLRLTRLNTVLGLAGDTDARRTCSTDF
jgi:anti-anti-sigma factor